MGLLSLQQLADPAVLKRLLSSFTEATGIRAVILDTAMEPVIGVEDYTYHCRLCQLVNSVTEGAERCRETYRRACRAVELIDPCILFCHAGLVHWAAPIKLQDQVLGTIICGQAIMWELDEQAMQEIFNQVADLCLPPRELRAAIQKLRVVPARQVQQGAELLKKLAARVAASSLSSLGATGQQEKRGPLKGPSLWNWLVERAPWEQGNGYQLDLENELASRVRLGDRLGAETILENLLGNILFTNIGRAEIIKYRLLELLAILSRAAAAGGARPEEILNLSAASMQKISTLSLEESFIWLLRTLDEFMDRIYRARESRQTPPVEKAVAYINTNYRQSIGLEDIAVFVDLSPAHLSRLFKKEMGRTVIEYLNLVRIEAAKRLLREGKTIEEVATATGFNEVTYFSRVFKREVGVTPGTYRSRYA
ncbi:histidine kinase [Moorella sp. E308F]|uniref:PocR ligand-binding domain-containing protein n=1 Tax=Moorella sp. E308F TaxID=2572682 RepID=UPI0010FFB517|nr:PocR ligand-binding domain-containing protein [Moorella sp. E308F]GEA14744.1 histidine kinase [Moorella sp. E308F]